MLCTDNQRIRVVTSTSSTSHRVKANEFIGRLLGFFLGIRGSGGHAPLSELAEVIAYTDFVIGPEQHFDDEYARVFHVLADPMYYLPRLMERVMQHCDDVFRTADQRVIVTLQRPAFKDKLRREQRDLAMHKCECLAVLLRWECSAVRGTLQRLFDMHRSGQRVVDDDRDISRWVMATISRARIEKFRLDVRLKARDGLRVLDPTLQALNNRQWFLHFVRHMVDRDLKMSQLKNVPMTPTSRIAAYNAFHPSRAADSVATTSRRNRSNSRSGNRQLQGNRQKQPPRSSNVSGNTAVRSHGQYRPRNAFRNDGKPHYDNWTRYWQHLATADGISWPDKTYCVRVNLGEHCRGERGRCQFQHKCGFCKQAPHPGGFSKCPTFLSLVQK